jgi:hypothetical protein
MRDCHTADADIAQADFSWSYSTINEDKGDTGAGGRTRLRGARQKPVTTHSEGFATSAESGKEERAVGIRRREG